jgi:PAS domain S-box-containing protein
MQPAQALLTILLLAGALPGRAEPLRLQLKWKHQYQFAGYYAARDQGYYAAEGLDVRILEGGPDRPPLATVLGGGADFGVSDTDVLLARLKGAPVVVCAAIFQHSPYILLSRSDRGIRTPADLLGARVMLSDDQGAAQFQAMLRKEGLDPGKVTIVGQSWNLDDLVAGRIDAMSAYATVEPAQLRARGVEPAVLRALDYGVDLYGDTLFTTEDMVGRHPDRVAAFVRASLKGWAFAFEHSEPLAASIAAMPGVAERGITREMLAEEARLMRPFVLPDVVAIGHMNPGRWQSIAQLVVEAGQAPSTDRVAGLVYSGEPAPFDARQVRRLALFALAAAVLAGGALLWNVQMRRSVRLRTEELRAEALQRKQVEAELRASEERLSLMFQGAATGITVTDAEGRFVYANPAFCRTVGYAEAELRAADFQSITHPDDCEASHEARDRLLSGEEQVVVFEKRYLRKGGGPVWVRLSVSLLRRTPDGPVQFVAVSEDITERRQAELLLAAQHRVLEMIGLGAPLGATLDALLGAVEEQSPGLIASILLLDREGRLRHASAPRLSPGFRQAIDGGGIGEGEGSCGTAAHRGEPVFVADIAEDPLWTKYRGPAEAEGLRACWSTPIFDAERRVIGTFALYFREPGSPTPEHLALIDMATQTAAIAIGRKREEEAVRDSQQRLRSIYDTVGDVIFLVAVEPDGEFRFESVNQRFVTTTGLPAEAVVGKRVEEVIPADSLPLVLARYRQAVEERTVVRWEETSDYPVGRLTGEVSVAPIVDAGGECTHLVGAVHDVTARKRAEERHAQAEGMLRQSQKLESIGRLAGGVAHDFNNILGVILGYAEMMLTQTPDGHRARPRLEQIIKAAQRAAGLTRQLLAFSRKQVMRPQPLDLNAVIADMRGMLERLVGEDLEFEVRSQARLRTVEADRTQVEQVVMNLVVNARDAMPRGGRLIIETANADFDDAYAAAHPPATAGSFAMLAVSDTGIGMDAETQRRVFEPFFTTKGPGEGTGLGLATVYGIVKQMGGYIWVYSEVGRGTTFKIYLPRVHQAATPEPPSRPKEPTPAGRETVLLVEDSDSVRGLVEELLVGLGYRVHVAANGEEALDRMADGSLAIDLLLTDVVMPKLGGHALAQRLRATLPGLRVVYMSGYTDGAISRQGLIEDGGTLLEKPFTAQTLGRTIREVLDAGGPGEGASAGS